MGVLDKLKFIDCRWDYKEVTGWRLSRKVLFYIFGYHYEYAQSWYSTVYDKYALELWDYTNGRTRLIDNRSRLVFNCPYKLIKFVHDFILKDEQVQILEISKDKPFISQNIIDGFISLRPH